MSELWKDIPGAPGYQASNIGRIRSLTRLVRCENGFRTTRGKLLSLFPSKATGYLQVDVSGRRWGAHRLIALAWCDGFFDGAWIDHINGNRKDNRPENLEWVTPSQNAARPYALGRRSNPYEGKFAGAHSTSKAVISTCLATGVERHYAAAMEAVREGFDSGSISHCCAGKIKTHKGHTWRFAIKGGFMSERQAA